MKKGGHIVLAGGFTIVETLIVLAVSSMLFVIAATMISGRQAKTEFQVGSRDIQTKIQQIINETKSGYFGTDSTSDCSINSTPPPGLAFTSTGSLGARGNCVFIGKALVISDDTLVVYPLAGLRQSAGVDVTDPIVAKATVIPDSIQKYTLPYGMKFVGFQVDAGGYNAGTQGFSILTSLGATTSLGGQTFNLHRFSTSFTGDAASAENNINGELTASTPYQSASSVSLCVQSGGTDQSLKIIIGGDNSLTVRTEVKGNKTCAE